MIYDYPVKYNGEIYPPGTNVPDDKKETTAKTEQVEKAGSEEPKTTKRRK